MTNSEEVYENRYYTLGEILKGMIIVTFALVVCDSYNDVFAALTISKSVSYTHLTLPTKA